tara:strand:+ start:10077 stop:10493 length:417 start_codon:yes stop_codon:yes gene_type:complete
MLPVIVGCAQQGAGTVLDPLRLSIVTDGTAAFTDFVIGEVEGGGAFTTAAGDFDMTAVATGGTGSYSFSWTFTILLDPSGSAAVVSTGASADRNDTATFSGVAADPPNETVIRVVCSVDDGSDIATDDTRFTLVGIAI